jgi:hypothetical protein
MDSRHANNVEPRKEWIAPELKKVDIETITAAGSNPTDDGFGNAS